ncbi:hypothetical protein ABZU45_39850 [Streptomyces avermitilis]|uniref:hypothetical protein n=1 Tax=Streptomyces avermitilis TaxID=33903 RepID=UPI0033B0309F
MERLVGDRWWLLLGDRQILAGKNEFPSRLMTVFQEEDKYMQTDWARAVDELNEDPGQAESIPERVSLLVERYEDVDSSELFGYRTTVGTVLARLRLMGFTPEASRRSMAEARRSRLADYGHDENALHVRPTDSMYPLTSHSMSCEQVVDVGLAAHIKGCTRNGFTGDDLDPVELACAESLEEYLEYESYEPRFILSALLHEQDPNNTVTVDLSDLLAADYCRSVESLSAEAVRELSQDTVSTGPIIVITEGKFDAKVIPRALRLVRPDIAGYFKFWDLETTVNGH